MILPLMLSSVLIGLFHANPFSTRTTQSRNNHTHVCWTALHNHIVGTLFCVSLTLSPCSCSALTHPSALVDIARKIWGVDRDARDAFLSLLNECCNNDLFCSDLLTSHGISNDYDSRDARRDAVLKHVLSGMCASAPFPSCRLLAHNSMSTAH